MSKKKSKFDLTYLVHESYLKEGEILCFVSDPNKTCTVTKMPNGEYKVKTSDGKIETIHSFAQACLGTEPPDHASKWVRTQAGKSLFDLWHSEDVVKIAA